MPKWGPIGQEVYERTYSRTKPDGSKEEWDETVGRVIRGNLDLVDDTATDKAAETELLTGLFSDFAALPAGRHLWASGAQTTLGLSNCHRAGWGSKLSEHFAFTFDQLMLGGGVGANYSSEYLEALPMITDPVGLTIVIDADHPDADEVASDPHPGFPAIEVEDSREGWVDALEFLIDAYSRGLGRVHFDLSKVRPRGAAIVGFGGTASGPGPLADMLRGVNETLNRISEAGRGFLSPLDAMAIDHAIAQCVVAGNVRRSARMSILHWRDPFINEFIKCKSDPSQHWTTNISVEVDDDFRAALQDGDRHAEIVLESVVEGMLANGEPGIFNSSLASQGERGDVRSTNPCGEIALEPWEQCTLGHINLSHFADDHAGAIEAFRAMARYLVRATLGKSSDPRQAEVKARNRRIGVGFYGFADWASKLGCPYSRIPENFEVLARLKDYAEAVRDEADRYSAALGVPAPVKTTTVAPTGTIAKLAGVSEGIQPPFGRYFIRRVRYAADDPKLVELADAGHLIEPCVYSANTSVVSFYCADPILSEVDASVVEQSNEVSLQSYLGVQAAVQDVYADNAISITANFERDDIDADQLAELLKVYLPDIKGFTVMPNESRPQSPYELLTAEQFYAYSGPKSYGQAIDDCANGACPVR